MSENDNPDEPIELGMVHTQGPAAVEFHGEPDSVHDYKVTAYPAEYRESDGEYGIAIEESISVAGGFLNRHHSFSPEEARELAARLTAAADKLGHVPDDDAPQPAEL